MDSLLNIIIALLGPDAVRDDDHYPASVPSFLVPRERFIEAARGMKQAGSRLVAEWATDERNMEITLPFKGRDRSVLREVEGVGMGYGIYTCFSLDSEYIIINCRIPINDQTFPSLTRKFVPASRFERQMRSLMGVIPVGHPDPRPWIKHEDWPEDAYPLRKDFDPSRPMPRVK